MLKFDPPELQQIISDSIASLVGITKQDVDRFGHDLIDPAKDDFDPSSYEDITISASTELYLWMPQSECERSFVRNYNDLFDIVKELHTAKTSKNTFCITDKRILVQVDCADSDSYEILNSSIPDTQGKVSEQDQKKWIELNDEYTTLRRKLNEFRKESSNVEDDKDEWKKVFDRYRLITTEINKLRPDDGPFERYFSLDIEESEQKITCSITQGITIFGLVLLAEGKYSEIFPPATDYDLFIEIQYEKSLQLEEIENIIQAYLFELSSNVNINLEIKLIPDIETIAFDEFEEIRKVGYRLRPLLLGKGVNEPLKLYNQAVTAADTEIQILFFTKAIEYISQTVVRQSFIETIRGKLLSPQALEPDARFIKELASLVDEQRIFTKDREAIKLTLKTCCDATELAKISPDFVEELKQVSVNTKKNERDRALEQLGTCLADTRNSMAHAKANYSPTGNECPPDEFEAFVSCIKLATQQVIRWYCSQPDYIRVS
jgi:hypothetical protein